MQTGNEITEQAELIIYHRRGKETTAVDTVKKTFLKSANVSPTDPDWASLLERIHVIVYDDSDPRIFLNTRLSAEAGDL